MKREYGARGLCSLLVLVLAAVTFSFIPVQAATMAVVDPLPSLDPQVDKPTAVAVDAEGKVYVAESLNNRVLIFSQGGALLAKLTGPSKPISVAVDTGGRIYVGSAFKGNVTVYDSGLQELFKLGGGDGEFLQPADIDIDAGGRIYVTDKEQNAVLIYSSSGQWLKNIGTPGNGDGQLHHPSSMAIDTASSELVIIDHQQIWDDSASAWIDGSRIQFFSIDGAFLRGYAKFGFDLNAGQLLIPVQVAVDGASRIYVTDCRMQKVMVYTNGNTFLGQVDNSTAPLRTPLGLAMSATGRLYVSSMLGGRVNVFGIDGYSAMNVLPASLGFTATADGNPPALQDATITNSGKGELVWTATTSTPWLSLPAAAGTLPPAASGALAVGVRPEGLAPGSYQGSVKVTAPGMAEEVTVTLTVRENPLRVSPGSLLFTATTTTTPAAQSLAIVSGDSAPLSWSVATDQSWLALNKNGGNAPNALRVYADNTGLTAGSYTATITVSNLSDGGQVTVPVSLTISESAATPVEAPDLPLPGKGVVKAGGKNWRTVRPVPGTTLRGVWGTSRKELLAVGDGGTIVGYDGKRWSPMISATQSALQGIWGSGVDNVYSVGDAGLALHFDGAKWTAVGSGTEETLLDVWGTAATKVQAVGFAGTILDDTFTAAYASGVALRSIWGSSATDLFAVGENGSVLRHDGSAWTPMVTGTSQWLNAVWGSSASDVFAVGEGGSIIHYDGSAWRVMESGIGETLHGVYGAGPDDVYAVGDGGLVLHYDGGAWQVVLAGGVSLRDVWTADRLVVAVGDDGMILTGTAGSFPWGIINHNISFIGQQQKALEKGNQDKEGQALQSPALQGPETR